MNKDKFKELWSNEKYKAIIKLGFYFLFIIIVVLFGLISSKLNTNVKKDTMKNKSIVSLLEDKVNNEINYVNTYDDTINKIVYEGKKDQNKNTGVKETSQYILKYVVNDTGQYEDKMGELTLINNLYEGINYNYFDENYLISLISDKTPTISNDGDKKNYSFYLTSDENISLDFILMEDKIIEITLNNQKAIYKIEY